MSFAIKNPQWRIRRIDVFVATLCLLVSTSVVAQSTLPRLAEDRARTAVIAALAEGADPDTPSSDGTTALHWAVNHGDTELVRALLDAGAAPGPVNDYGVTPIATAAIEADTDIIEALLDAGADVESPNGEGQTVLMAVARTGNVAAAQLLLERGADVNTTEDFGGQSALMWASAQSQPDMIRVLLRQGAQADARGRIHDWERRVTSEPRIKIMHAGGFTPLLYAAREGCIDCISALVDGGADIDLTDPDGITPLLLALLNRNFDAAGRLMELGADIDRWDWWGRTPLYVAVDLDPVPDSRYGDLPSLDRLTGLDVAMMLLERGANVDARLRQQPPLRSEPGDRGYTDGSPDVLVLTTGATALHTAVKSGNDAAIRLLLEHGADVSFPNVFGITPILAAAGLGHWYGIFRDFPTRGRYRTGADAVVTMQILLDAGADISVRSSNMGFGFQRPLRNGLTAAHGAAFSGWNEVLEFLVELGIDIDAVSGDGVTPRDLAVIEERTDTVAFIDDLLGR